MKVKKVIGTCDECDYRDNVNKCLNKSIYTQSDTCYGFGNGNTCFKIIKENDMKATDIGDIELFLGKIYCLLDDKKLNKNDNDYFMAKTNIDNALKYKKNIKCDDIYNLSKYIEETYEASTGDIVIVNDSNIYLACKKNYWGSLYFYDTKSDGSKDFDVSILYHCDSNKIMYTCRDKFNEKIYLVEIGNNLSREEKIRMKIIEDKSENAKEEIIESVNDFRFSIEVKDDNGHELNFKSKEESFTAVSECLDYINKFEKINYVYLYGDSDLILYAVNRLLETFKIKLIFSTTYSDKDKTLMRLEAKE